MHRIALYVFLGMGLHVQAHAQNTFNNRYDPLQQNRPDFAWGIEQTENDGFLVISVSPWSDSIAYNAVITLTEINEFGVTLNVNRFVDVGYRNFPGWSNTSDRSSTGSIVFGGSRGYGADPSMACIYVVDPNGVVLNQYVYGIPDYYWIGRQAKHTSDGGYVLVGDYTDIDNVSVFLIKTDSNGEQEWVQTYGGPYNDYVGAVGLDGVGGYYLGGEYGTTSGNLDFWLKRVDGSGNQIWNRTWGSGYTEPNAHLETLADGHVVVASAWRWENYNTGRSRLYMAKLDSADGSFIWQHYYGVATVNTTFFAVKEVTPGGDLIAAGQAAAPGTALDDRGVMLRTNSDGDSLWMRYYSYQSALVDSGRGKFRDVLPTPDGGFIAVGVAYAAAINTGGGYTQDVWVLKTDSMGCIEPGCHLITGMETQLTNLKDALRVWPNPVLAGSAVQVELNLPESFKPEGQLQLTVTNGLGQLMHRQGLSSGSTPQPLNFPTSQLSSGLYHLHLHDNTRWITGAKLVVE